MLDAMRSLLGLENVLTGDDAVPWGRDATGKYVGTPRAVLRPFDTAQVSAILAAANDSGTGIVPVSGNTGLNGGAFAEDQIVVSLDRMRKVRDIRPETRLAVVEAGVILSDLHEAAHAEGLSFPMTFGARGSARIGGILATNAGGSNVLRYGNTRDLVLGIEAVMADGRVMNLLTELHKNNTGYDLRHLLIGAEGTLGIITAAVVKLVPRPRAYATATIATGSLADALTLLNRLREASSGAVEAFEYMPDSYISGHLDAIPGAREPFSERHPVTLLTELGATSPKEAEPGPDGEIPLVATLEATLAEAMEDGLVRDATIARSESQRTEMWARREAAAEIAFHKRPFVDTDIALPLDRLQAFFDEVRARLARLDAGATDLAVAHLGDGNIHYTVYPTTDDAALLGQVRDIIDTTSVELGGTFSAEHGIGISKLGPMSRFKDPVALSAMQAIKRALDPKGILNPGKTLPAES
ncbi:FAD-binding oxidoreductase [Pelagovum pacificum]|uniref:FAD-binding oxidoreductase n=1 Tax=Pelagovum pacificum TaxID=2588711 RepID=A0A5C5GC55_9RHOB|nr:FAD-binding oxidoreductase [Pelagovum pacificum]QQA42478.1 FAD-binding oxidoreductase [Pelagovum pacificum]TNY31562.1 FAD-binding oxidoreductase [Pelagovum pacificum]